MHGIDNNLFKIYLLSENGLLLHQTISVGQIHKYNLTELQGHMKASPDNGMLAVTLRQTDETGKLAVSAPFEIFDFNNKTGVISYPRSLGNYALQYGVSFSPNSEILYLHGFADSGINQGDLLYQLI
ncbi:hypothetical protein [Fulvivirga ligni]|uniref:hypothetical protein n=1 Tax=Fulvivirga ligni TaxID=2904246 RepID=UPI001F1D803F|nr:hypothetical protein [Fulvivirga ligni]UII20796.1 hypothetical protein LVD16_23430 [Fulvivirga ligni]